MDEFSLYLGHRRIQGPVCFVRCHTTRSSSGRVIASAPWHHVLHPSIPGPTESEELDRAQRFEVCLAVATFAAPGNNEFCDLHRQSHASHATVTWKFKVHSLLILGPLRRLSIFLVNHERTEHVKAVHVERMKSSCYIMIQYQLSGGKLID